MAPPNMRDQPDLPSSLDRPCHSREASKRMAILVRFNSLFSPARKSRELAKLRETLEARTATLRHKNPSSTRHRRTTQAAPPKPVGLDRFYGASGPCLGVTGQLTQPSRKCALPILLGHGILHEAQNFSLPNGQGLNPGRG